MPLICFSQDPGMEEITLTDYVFICSALCELNKGVDYEITILANASALLYSSMEQLNWAGFYLMRDGELILGPFQGRPACTVIGMGKGVCGTAAVEDRTVVVPDVHLFPGHIACDSASRSEIVVPIHINGRLYGVLDIDSPVKKRFSEDDRSGLEQFAGILENCLAEGLK